MQWVLEGYRRAGFGGVEHPVLVKEAAWLDAPESPGGSVSLVLTSWVEQYPVLAALPEVPRRAMPLLELSHCATSSPVLPPIQKPMDS